MEKLRQRVEEVDHLRDKKQQHRLAEVPKDTHHGKGHASEVAEGVSHEHTGGVPTLGQERKQIWQSSKELFPQEGGSIMYNKENALLGRSRAGQLVGCWVGQMKPEILGSTQWVPSGEMARGGQGESLLLD